MLNRCVNIRTLAVIASSSRRICLPKYLLAGNHIQRHLSNKPSFADTLKKMKKDTGLSDDNKSSPVSEEAEINNKESIKSDDAVKAETEYVETPPSNTTATPFSWSNFVGGITSALNSSVSKIKGSFTDAPKGVGVIEVEKSYMRRKIHQAITITRSSTEPVEREDNYDGPTAMVLVKDPLSPWESMKARLRSQPLINELLKRGFKVSQAASETTVGKKVGAVGQIVQDKISVSISTYKVCMCTIY